MGARANIVIKRDGKWKLYYEHWAADTLDVELFYGPDVSFDWLVDKDPEEEWLDETWCEGAAVIDFDAKLLLWFGGHTTEDVVMRKLHRRLMQKNWPGWCLCWAVCGLADILLYLDVAKPDERFRGSTRLDLEYEPNIVGANDALVSIADGDEVLVAMLCGNARNLFAGNRAIEDVVDVVRQHGRPTLEWDVGPPCWGLHVDIQQEHVSMWTAAEVRYDSSLESYWAPWGVSWWKDDYEKHLALLGGRLRLSHESAEQTVQGLYERIRREVDADIERLTDELRIECGYSDEEWAAELALQDEKLRRLESAFAGEPR